MLRQALENLGLSRPEPAATMGCPGTTGRRSDVVDFSLETGQDRPENPAKTSKVAGFPGFSPMPEPSPTTIALEEARLRLVRIAEAESLGRALGKLEPALTAVADALVALTPAEWAALCREEREQADAVQEMRSAGFGTAGPLLPALVLGNAALEIFAAKYPQLARDPPNAA
jgi:hypothetical protein